MNNKQAIEILEAMKHDAIFSQRFALGKAIESLSRGCEPITPLKEADNVE